MPDRTAAKSEQTRRSVQLVLLSSAILYLELAIIRFTSAEVLYLGFFSNFILISVFVGLGLGFLSSKTPSLNQALGYYYPVTLVLLFALILVSRFDVDFLKDRDGLHFFGNVLGSSRIPGFLLLPLLFFLVAGLFLLLGREVACLFPHFPPLRAYMLDIAGSLGGILLFTAQSAFSFGPVVWILTGSALLCLGFVFAPPNQALAKRSAWQVVAAGTAVCVLLIAARAEPVTAWSPYQKLAYYPGSEAAYSQIHANGILHQLIIPPDVAKEGWYGIPYAVHAQHGGKLDDVLIIGAGSGTDLSVALLHPVKSVDAVEIDPVIVDFGRKFNQAAPYQDRRVRAHITDGRAYLRNTEKKYDLIIFALPDSLLRVSSLSNVRLESYLFTVESFHEAKQRLKPGGSLFLYNQYRWDWLRDRISSMLASAFERAPYRNDMAETGTTVFGVGDNIPSSESSARGSDRVATDDWPHVYMEQPGVSWFYLCMIGMFLAAALGGVYCLAPEPTLRKPDWPFFFMGAAFLLLEARSISVFSLLFGTTWLVNSLVFAGILFSVLLANVAVSRYRISNRGMLFSGLLVSIGVAYFCSPADLLDLDSTALRYLLSVLLYFSPIFFANLIFSREFRDFEDSQTAFGWNLLGAVLGGGAEYLGLAIGNRNLLLLALAFYGLCGWTLARQRRSNGNA